MSRLVLLFVWLPAAVRSACGSLDHQACDELCKVDNFWYGHCSGWDGKDFGCKCYPYAPPLNGTVCREKQDHCAKKCEKQGSEGGFCYPQKEGTGSTTACQCFKELQLRRRKRSAGYRRI